MMRREIASNSAVAFRRLLHVKQAPLASSALSVCGLALSILLLAATLCANGTKQPPLQPVDINRATAAELERVPGIGQRTAEAIVRLREKSGPYKRVEDLLAIRGISQSRLQKLRPYLTVGAPARPKTK